MVTKGTELTFCNSFNFRKNERQECFDISLVFDMVYFTMHFNFQFLNRCPSIYKLYRHLIRNPNYTDEERKGQCAPGEGLQVQTHNKRYVIVFCQIMLIFYAMYHIYETILFFSFLYKVPIAYRGQEEENLHTQPCHLYLHE